MGKTKQLSTQGDARSSSWQAVHMANAMIKVSVLAVGWLAAGVVGRQGRQAHTDLINRRARRISTGRSRPSTDR